VNGGKMSRRPHEKLDVWKKDIELTAEIYEITGRYPREERIMEITDRIGRMLTSLIRSVRQ